MLNFISYSDTHDLLQNLYCTADLHFQCNFVENIGNNAEKNVGFCKIIFIDLLITG